MSTSTVTVSIGRNINGQPMSDRQWDRFTSRTEAIVLSEADSFRNIHFTGTGTGWWVSDKGTESEESFTIVATIEARLVPELEARLAVLAHVFGQEAVAVTAGVTTIVPAVRSRR